MRINVDAGYGSNTAGKRTHLLPVAIDIDKDSKEFNSPRFNTYNIEKSRFYFVFHFMLHINS